ncbi:MULTISPECIES: hypothetical protein [unclassified Synechococcus]|uniref:hypothetical protein n=1 Tax=unclassified Synechococcus TaxID=2626047 RepID=UPI000068F61C|nr:MULTISPECIES: hypothetical protein [unclassified Synechococcus]EAQ69635.1 hypothetical protein RS9917_09376 [Synechococcus sp. RS9917]
MSRTFSRDLAQSLALMLLELDAELQEFAFQVDVAAVEPCAALATPEPELLPPLG